MDIADFIAQVRRNCDISDARYWGYYSICGLLMRYRELYLNEQGLQPWDHVETVDITPWIQERERRWELLEEEDFSPLVIDGREFSPFDSDGVNALLCGSGLVYGSGYGVFTKPTFFVAGLAQRREEGDWLVHYTVGERCRDLFAAPAMLQGRCIFVRRDIIRIILWERYQTMRSRTYGGALAEMFRLAGIGKEGLIAPDFSGRLDALADSLSPLFVRHEIGEAFEDDYGDVWLAILLEGCDKYGELYLRAIKDVLADTSIRGPLAGIIREKDAFLMTAFAAFFEGTRREVFPDIRTAFHAYVDSGDWAFLEEARREAYEKAALLRDKVINYWREARAEAGRAVFTKETVEELLK